MCHASGVRIALVTDCFLPRLGGIEVQVSELARRLCAAGHDVEVFTITPDRSAGDAGAATSFDDAALPYGQGHPVHRMPLPVRLPAGLLANPLATPELHRRLRGGGFDVVHAPLGVVSPFAFEGVRIAVAAGIPVAVTWHSMVGRFASVWRASGLLDSWARQGAALSAVSQVAAAAISRASRSGVRVDVLPNALDVGEWWVGASSATVDGAEADPASGGDPENPATVRVVAAMRLAPRKRPMELLEAARRARTLAPGIRTHLELIGDGELRGRLERSIREHGDGSWVSLPGRLTRDELKVRYAAADLYLSPVRLEAFGIAALEGRCRGLPVVGYAGSGVAEFVEHGVNGLLVDSDEAFSQAVARLAVDHALRLRMRRHNATTPPRRFDWPEVIEATLAQYRRAGAR